MSQPPSPKTGTAYRPVILSVDDRPQNLLAMATLLRNQPAEVINADSGAQALEIALSRNDIAVVLLDVQMPDMDGFETAEALRLMESTKHVPILFVTANSNEAENIFQGYEAGAVDYLPKPIPEHILRSKVGIYLEVAQQRHSLEKYALDLRRSKSELQRSNAALQEFAHSAAHDLKAPIRHICAWVTMLREDEAEGMSEGASELLDRIDKSASRMDNLVGGILALAQLDAAAPLFNRVELSQVLKEVVEELADSIAKTKARVTVGELPCVVGNAGLLFRLFENLIGNSLKYCKPGEPPVVEVNTGKPSVCSKGGSFCQIVVSDEGTGFPQELAESIFKPFRRLVGSAIEGSGIGMASARKIVDQHRGTIRAEGEEGVGAKFIVELPWVKDTLPD